MTTHEFADVALATGRFEMFALPNSPVHVYESILDVDSMNDLGLFRAGTIRGFLPPDQPGKVSRLLDAVGTREGSNWNLSAPSSITRSSWEKIARSGAVLDFSDFDNTDVEEVISRLHTPVTFALPLATLEGDWAKFIKKTLKSECETLHVAIGEKRAKFCFIGSGEPYEQAVSIARRRPPYFSSYPIEDYREIVRSRSIFHPKKQA